MNYYNIPDEPIDGWTKESFQKILSPKQQRAALCRDFGGLFYQDPKNKHLRLIGTKYYFYVTEWTFGYLVDYSPALASRYLGGTKFYVAYFPFESLLDSDIPNEIKEKLIFYLDFLRM